MSSFYDGKRVLVTGASSGIGRSFVLELSQRGAQCLALARRSQALLSLQQEVEASGGHKPEIIVADLLSEAGFNLAQKTIGRIDILINNAGMGMNGRFLNAKKVDLARLFELNFNVPVRLSQQAAIQMRPRNDGAILNVASIAGMVPTPFHAAYSATKAGLLNFTEALHSELRSHNIHVTALCPGVTDTEFFDAGGYDTKSLVYRLPRQSAGAVVRAGLKGLSKNKITVVPGLQTRLLVAMTKMLPRSVITAAAGMAMSTD